MLKIFRIRICSQCKDPLPLKCNNCLKHPDRKPRQIDFCELPPILRTCSDCKKCIGFACQRPECKEIAWKPASYFRTINGKKYIPATAVFCSNECVGLYNGMNQLKGKEVKCANCPKKMWRRPAELKNYAYSVCSKSCGNIYRAKLKYAEQKAALKELNDPSVVMLECLNGCKDITEHKKIKPNLYQCGCGKTRTASMYAGSV